MNPSTPAPSSNQAQLTGSAYSGDTGFGGNLPNIPQPSTTMNASQLGAQTPSIQFPNNLPSTQNTATLGTAANASIPTPQSIISQETAQTPAEATNTGLLGKLASLIGGKSSLATQQQSAEQAAGVPGMTKTVNDLNTQLMGLTDQATALANNAAPGGAIQNQEQQNAQGRGITTGGQAPLNAADLRTNQIQQAAIASQALTVKSAYYAAQGNLTLAKDSADKAAQVAFDAQQQQINYVNALIEQNKPDMTKQEQAQADLVKTQLADRQTQIDQQKTDYTTGIGLINSAMKLNGQDPQAQLAIQKAQQISPQDPQYIQKVGALLAQYQQDPIATQQALANLQNTRADIAYKQQQTAALRQAGDGGTIASDNLFTSGSGRQYVDGSNLTGKDLAAAQAAAAKAGVPFASKTDKPFLQNIDITRQNLISLDQALSNTTINGQTGQSLSPQTSIGHLYDAYLSFPLQSFTQAGPQSGAIANYNDLKGSMISAVKAIGGPGSGARGATLAQQLMQQIPDASDTAEHAKAKLDAFTTLLNSAESGILGPATKQGTLPDGTVVTQNSDGSITDAKGNKYDQSGKRI